MIYNLNGAGGAPDADQIPYENYTSGLDAENVQEAIDEVQDNIETVQNNVDTVNGRVTSVNNKVDTIKVYVGADGNLYFRNGLGADTALNFSSGKGTLIWTNPHPDYWSSNTKMYMDLTPYPFIIVQCGTFYNLVDISNLRGTTTNTYLSDSTSGFRYVRYDNDGIYVNSSKNRWDYDYRDENSYKILCVPKFVWGFKKSPL